MRVRHGLAATALLLALLGAGACGKSKPSAATPTPDGGITPDVGSTVETGALANCLDSPNDLPRPPTGQLPCELIPPRQ
jgi:hypothetical protein